MKADHSRVDLPGEPGGTRKRGLDFVHHTPCPEDNRRNGRVRFDAFYFNRQWPGGPLSERKDGSLIQETFR